VDYDPSDRNYYAGTELEQPLAQHADLSTGTSCAGSTQAQFLHQDVGGCGEQDAKLVRPKTGATRAIDLQIVQLLNTIFDVAALAVHLFVNPLRALLQVGDKKAGIVLGILS
jgi:hypothetical protein